MNKFFASYLAAVTLLLSQASPSIAQQNSDAQINPAPATQPDQTASDTAATNRSRAWVWFLPLLLLPLFFLGKKDVDDDDSLREYRDSRFAGTKGGKSKRTRR